jgi:biopolymer transport protein ExbD
LRGLFDEAIKEREVMGVTPASGVATMAIKGGEDMNWTALNPWGRPSRRVWSLTFVVLVTMLFAAPLCTAQKLQKGVSVELAVTRNAIAMPEADNEGALIIAVTHSGSVYFGIGPITPAALAKKLGPSHRAEERLYIKADARTPYANVAEVLAAVRTAGVVPLNLLTAQPETPEPGERVPPKGLEVALTPPLPLPSGAEQTVVQILNSGGRQPLLKINNEDIPWANLESRLTQLQRKYSLDHVFVKADGQLPYGDVVHVIDVCLSRVPHILLVTSAT